MANVAKASGLNPFANELHEGRATQAKAILPPANVVNDDYRNLRTPKGAYKVLYLNPPYDWDRESGREEYAWLKRMRPLLAPGGLLIWIIPELILKDPNVQRYISVWFDDVLVYRFRGDSYEDFNQVVLYGINRKKSTTGYGHVARAIKQLSTLGPNLPEHPVFAEPYYTIGDIFVPSKFHFYGQFFSPESVELELEQYGIQTRDDYKSFLSPDSRIRLSPLAPLKIGHMASTIAAGHMNNEVITTVSGERMMIKGSVYTEPVSRVETEHDSKKSKTKTITVHDPRSVITTISENGEIAELKNEELASFLQSNIESITTRFQELFPPAYAFELGEWADHLKGVNPRQIPNMDRKGLLPAQGHSAAAVCTRWENGRDAVLVGQVGTGKTVMSVAAAYAQHSKYGYDHFVVMCPPHLVNKWIREIVATWPGAKAMALTGPNTVDRFFATEGPIFGIVKSTSASQGDGWEHAIDYNGPFRIKRRKSKRNKLVIIGGRQELIDAYKFKSDSEAETIKAKAVLYKHNLRCPNCFTPLIQRDKKNKDAYIPMILEDFVGKKLYCDKCDGPLWQDIRSTKRGKYPIATYIHRKHKGYTDILIVDEAHQYKGDSDRGKAYAQMVVSSKRVLAMTGTIYGGKATTLFLLLYRLSQEFRKEWSDHNAEGSKRVLMSKWGKTYGVLEETISHTESSNSAKSGNNRTYKNSREIAGSSPAMLPWLLNRSVFVSLSDMGMALPNFQEIAVDVQMSESMAKQYGELYSTLKAALAATLVRNDRSMLSKYLNALIYWPDSPWRGKAVYVRDKEEPIVSIPGVDMQPGEAPKEQAIIQVIKDELAEGRKCVLMTLQTNTLDIQPQWQDMLQRNGISSAILKEDTDKREQWILNQTKKGTQVIITHPKKVETGLDILDYPTIIWMAPFFSIYTVIQASGRAFRLGQTKDCKVYHFAYTDTIQGDALRLVIAKAAAAMRVNGDTIESDDLADLDALASNSMEQALASIIKEGVDHDLKMTQIDLDYELAQDDIFEGYFSECVTQSEAKTLYRELAKQNHPDTKQEVEGGVFESLNDMFAKAFDEFSQSSQTIGGEEMTDDEALYEDIEPEPEPVVVEETPPPVVVEVEPEPPTVDRLVFGKSLVQFRRRKAEKPAVSSKVIQLSLFD